MHELPVTEKILEIALSHAAKNKAKRIFSITLKVGGLTDLQGNWLQRYFDYLSRGTIAEGAELIIIPGGVQLRCDHCRTLIETTREKLQDEICPHCGSVDGLSIFSGREYFIEEMAAQ